MTSRKLKRARWMAFGVAALLAAPGLFAQEPASSPAGEQRREQWQKVEEIFEAMGIRPGAHVADIGAGNGFFTTRLARAVGPSGKVLAVDISPNALQRLRARVAEEELTNVDVIEGAAADPRLPEGSLDAVLIVNAYHEMADHEQILAKIRAALKPDGRLVIVEPISPAQRDGSRVDQTSRHQIAADHVAREGRAAGFRQLRLEDPFTARPGGHAEEWILVLTPAAPAAETAGPAPRDDLDSPDLRIAPADFDRLVAKGGVLVLDVRDAASYARGHLPGAVLLPVAELPTSAGVAAMKSETRSIVTYCS